MKTKTYFYSAKDLNYNGERWVSGIMNSNNTGKQLQDEIDYTIFKIHSKKYGNYINFFIVCISKL